MEMSKSNFGVSVIVPVYNAEGNIRDLIDALLKQTRLPDEILFVDDGSTDSSRRILEATAGEKPGLKYFYQTNQGSASARNFGWKNSSNEICVFTDDDCVPEQNWLEELLKPLEDPA